MHPHNHSHHRTPRSTTAATSQHAATDDRENAQSCSVGSAPAATSGSYTRFGQKFDAARWDPWLRWFNVAVVVGMLIFEYLRLPLLDTGVYRWGARALIDHVDLYGPTGGLPFTYPPFAALIFSPLLFIGDMVFTALSIAAMWWTLKLFGQQRWLGLALLSFPVYETLNYGQINLLLMALVLTDAIIFRRGYLIGIAAAIKVTPLVFLLYTVARRKWAMTAGVIGSFLACSALLPRESWRYYTEILSDTERIGNPEYALNQALQGTLVRLHTSDWVWLLSVVIIVALGTYKAYKAETDQSAVLIAALVGLVCSPVSWSHHWVWFIVAAILATSWMRVWIIFALSIFGAFQNFLPRGGGVEFDWPWIYQLLAMHYPLLALAVILSVRCAASPQRGTTTPATAGCSDEDHKQTRNGLANPHQ